MDIQILGLRDGVVNGKPQKYETFFSKGWRAPTVKELFANIDKYLAPIPDAERYNLYYTAANCLEEKGRKIHEQWVIPFDIDGIDETKLEEYIKCVLDTLKLERENTGIVFSGNGLQFIIGIDDPIMDREYFDEYRVFYKGCCGLVNQALYLLGLAGTADPSVWSPARLLRLPNTKNIKPKKGEKHAYLIQPNISPITWDFKEKAGMPKISHKDGMNQRMLDKMPMPDSDGVRSGCEYLKFCYDNQDTISEPQWYAMLSIIGRLKDGERLVHDYSKLHPDYDDQATSIKTEQALKASGPRTCKNISSLWDGCTNCEYSTKNIISPIKIMSFGFIKTRETGFYEKDADGKTGRPQYHDLMLYFIEKHPFKTIDESGIITVWDETHWKDWSRPNVDEFPEVYFDPKPTNSMCNEFYGKLRRNSVVGVDWFNVQGRINFNNGVLDLETMDLSPHSTELGFKYTLPYKYDPLATCPRFDQFLSEVTEDDEELQQLLLEFMGYSISGIDASIGQKAIILVGDGANGKSVLMDVLKHMVGKDNYSTLTMGNEINKLENRYQLDGRLFNISEETPTKAMMDSSIFKALVTGGEVQARKLYSDAYSMKNTAKIWMACNELPATEDLTHGMFRRLLIAPFNAKFTEGVNMDKHIREKLFEEFSGIYNKVLKALLKFRRTKVFSISAAASDALREYQEDNDMVQEWFDSNMVPDAEAVEIIEDIYSEYRIRTEMMGSKAMDMVWFSRRLKKLYKVTLERKRVAGVGRRRVIKGYRRVDDNTSAAASI